MFVSYGAEPSNMLNKAWRVEELQISHFMNGLWYRVVDLLVLGVVIPVIENVRVIQYLLRNLTPEQIPPSPT